MNDNDLPRREEREIIEKGGYVPVTPLGPPPQAEALFMDYPSQPQSGAAPAQTPPRGSSQERTLRD